ncbi:hypothetical protein TAGGR_2361 [Thermodesulfovibrio aggregans]|uniref:Histidine kinase domain-containing protein n=1 Tax=Thermodesulfovibrio aggregans TaxID=86166 RepID=A0A0U9HR05_9BACT|nr:HAMP domain-containing histidine kinase [Thermodesulfovibrio aggregans]GAQ95468.1 hypothetical protein TAGGR_2361 [Thermodesulfovibrio aggregans]
MSFQLKIFIIFATSVVLIFSVINFITINFFKEQQQEEEILSKIPYPEQLKESYAKERFNKYSKTILIWEVLLILVLSYLFYRILNVISRKEKEHEEFLRFLFFVLSHKIGNFLSTMNTNIEILKIKPESRVLERMEKSCNAIGAEIQKTIEAVKKLPKISKSKQQINLEELIKTVISKFETDKKLLFSKREVYLNNNPEVVETIIFLLIDNAFRYSEKMIHIKIFRNAVAIRNDFTEIVKGSGLGLQIAEYLCRTSKLQLKYRAKGEHFIVLLIF